MKYLIHSILSILFLFSFAVNAECDAGSIGSTRIENLIEIDEVKRNHPNFKFTHFKASIPSNIENMGLDSVSIVKGSIYEQTEEYISIPLKTKRENEIEKSEFVMNTTQAHLWRIEVIYLPASTKEKITIDGPSIYSCVELKHNKKRNEVDAVDTAPIR